jgi:hypothetical protein avisC_01456
MGLCELDNSFAFFIFPLAVLGPTFALMALSVVGQRIRKAERARFYFRTTYNLSVDRMLAESPLDKNYIARLKGATFGRFAAVRYVTMGDPVPRQIAAKFIDAIWKDV